MKKTILLFLNIFLVIGAKSQVLNNPLLEDNRIILKTMDSINTIDSDISPFFVGDQIFYSSVREEYFNKKSKARKNINFYNLFSFTPGISDTARGKRIPVPGFGSKFHEGPGSYCDATGEMFVTLSNVVDPDTIRRMISKERIHLRIVIKKLIDGTWQTIEELPFNNKNYNFCHPAINTSGDTLIFCSDINITNFGKTDLYMSVRKEGKWSAPLNLGAQINTPGNEMFPTFLPGGYLSFSSDSIKNGRGGLDVWMTTYPVEGEIVNAGDIINGPYDDFGLIVNRDNTSGYFTSNRPGGKGNDDIYRYDIFYKPQIIKGRIIDQITGIPLKSALVTLTDCSGNILGNTTTGLDGSFTFESDKNRCLIAKVISAGYDEIIQNITGEKNPVIRLEKLNRLVILNTKITDKQNGNFISGARINIFKDQVFEKEVTDKDGGYLISLDDSSNYVLFTSAKGYFEHKTTINGSERKPGEYPFNIELEKISAGKEFIIEDLYYDLDKYNIRPDAAIVLDRLVNILKENPGIKIEIGSHTDSRGSVVYNQSLSQKRSESVVAYFKNHGIAAKRLFAKGYGESQLVNKCKDGIPCSEEEHQANRRTVIKILSMQ